MSEASAAAGAAGGEQEEIAAPLPPDEEKVADPFLEPVNEAAKHTATQTLIYIATLLYIALGVAKTTDEEILYARPLKLPLLDAEVSFRAFFFLGPLLLLLLHLHVLLQEYFLLNKMQKIGARTSEDRRALLFFPSLSVNRWLGEGYEPAVRWVLGTLYWIAYAVLPVAVLGWIQVRLLPYHVWTLTLMHQVSVGLDLVVVWYFVWLIERLRGVARFKELLLQPRRRFYIAVTLLIVVLSAFVAVVPGSFGRSPGLTDLVAEKLHIHRNLALENRVLAAPDGTVEEAHEVPPRGLHLVHRDLRFANLSHAKVVAANLGSADLGGAVLTGAELRGARMGNANLAGAQLSGAHLEQAELSNANLESARLSGAHLEEAELSNARLRGTDLSRAFLGGAILTGVDMAEARLEFADLTGVEATKANLIGAHLNYARVSAGNLSGAHLEGATLSEAHLEAVDFHDATLLGADLRNSYLQSAKGLRLLGVDLRGAHLAGVSLCPEASNEGAAREGEATITRARPGGPVPYLADLRDVEFTLRGEWASLERVLGRFKVGAAEAAMRRLGRANRNAGGCIFVSEPGEKNTLLGTTILYRDEQLSSAPFKDFPPVGQAEQDFYPKLATYLVREACADQEVAESFARRVAGEMPPHNAAFELALARELAGMLDDHSCKVAEIAPLLKIKVKRAAGR